LPIHPVPALVGMAVSPSLRLRLAWIAGPALFALKIFGAAGTGWIGKLPLFERMPNEVYFQFPVLYSLWVSFFDLRLTRPHRVPFVGFDNYVDVFQDELFWQSVWRTTSFTLACVVAIMLIALAMALLLNEEFRGRRFLSAMLLVPWAIPYVANGLMWKWIYDSGYGALNGILFQLDFIDRYMVWLGDSHKTLWLIANAFVWKEVPLATILVLVGLKSIPADLYSAARVDVILRAMRRDGVIDDDQLATARETSLHFAQTALHAD